MHMFKSVTIHTDCHLEIQYGEIWQLASVLKNHIRLPSNLIWAISRSRPFEQNMVTAMERMHNVAR